MTLTDDSAALVTNSDLRAILGVEWFRDRIMAGVAEDGYVFARTISADGVPEFNPLDTVMLSAGATCWRAATPNADLPRHHGMPPACYRGEPIPSRTPPRSPCPPRHRSSP